jgi:hypothetical protein
MPKLSFGLSIAIWLTPALADNLTVLGTLSGKCISATAMDVVTDSSLCMNSVVNIEFPNGRLGFMFNLRRKGEQQLVTISFFGDGTKQLHLNQDTAMQPIDRVHFTFKGSTDDLVAAGSCRFSNPFKGVPAQVSCSADTNQGRFAGEFISDGRSPNMSQIR